MPTNSISDSSAIFRPLKRESLSWPVWLAFLYAGIVLPIVCHATTLHDPPQRPRWQSGDLSDQLGFILSGEAGYPLYPFMAYPMGCLACLLWREPKFAREPLVRFGIITGIPVAAWYCVTLGMAIVAIPELLSARWMQVLLLVGVGLASPLLVWAALRALLWLRKLVGLPWRYVSLVLVAAIICSLPFALEFWSNLPVVASFFSLFFAPSWALLTYACMALRLTWRYPQAWRFTVLQMLAAISWLAAFLAACRWSILNSLDEYSQLPLEAPGGCYIASAAARGHPRVVRSHKVILTSGEVVAVNGQLQVLKAGELAIRALMPRLHQGLRFVYDHVGPPLARRLTNAYLADAAYLLLKPLEWTVWAVLVVVLGKESRRLDHVYGRVAADTFTCNRVSHRLRRVIRPIAEQTDRPPCSKSRSSSFP